MCCVFSFALATVTSWHPTPKNANTNKSHVGKIKLLYLFAVMSLSPFSILPNNLKLKKTDRKGCLSDCRGPSRQSCAVEKVGFISIKIK